MKMTCTSRRKPARSSACGAGSPPSPGSPSWQKEGWSTRGRPPAAPLGRIGTPEALRELVRIHEALPGREASGDWYMFANALEACGCEVDRADLQNPKYREPGAVEWKPLRRA